MHSEHIFLLSVPAIIFTATWWRDLNLTKFPQKSWHSPSPMDSFILFFLKHFHSLLQTCPWNGRRKNGLIEFTTERNGGTDWNCFVRPRFLLIFIHLFYSFQPFQIFRRQLGMFFKSFEIAFLPIWWNLSAKMLPLPRLTIWRSCPKCEWAIWFWALCQASKFTPRGPNRICTCWKYSIWCRGGINYLAK